MATRRAHVSLSPTHLGSPYLSPRRVCPRAGSPRPVLGRKEVVSRVCAPTSPPHSLSLSRGCLLPTWLRVLCDFCIQARHWSYRRKLRFEQYACFLSQPRNCLSSRRTGPELGSPPRGSHAPPPGPGRSDRGGAAASGRAQQRARAGSRRRVPARRTAFPSGTSFLFPRDPVLLTDQPSSPAAPEEVGEKEKGSSSTSPSGTRFLWPEPGVNGRRSGRR